MKIDKVFKAVASKERELMINGSDTITLAVYMNLEFWHECKCELFRKGYCGASYEFFNNDTVRGYPVYSVNPMIDSHAKVVHAPFRVVNLNN